MAIGGIVRMEQPLDPVVWGFKLRVPSGAVTANITGFQVYVDLSLSGNTTIRDRFHSILSNGGAVWVFSSDMTTRLPVERVWIDPVAKTGEIHFLTGSLLTASNNDFWIVFSKLLSDPAVTDIYGRNAVWADANTLCNSCCHHQSINSNLLINSSGFNVFAGVSDPTIEVGDTGNCTNFDINDGLCWFISETTNPVPDYPATFISRFKHNVTAANSEGTLVSYSQQIASNRRFNLRLTSNGRLSLVRQDTGGTSTLSQASGDLSDSNWHTAAAVMRSATDVEIYVDGVSVGTQATSRLWPTGTPGSESYNFRVGHYVVSTTSALDFPASANRLQDESRLYRSALSAAAIAAMHSNLSAPASFYQLSDFGPFKVAV